MHKIIIKGFISCCILLVVVSCKMRAEVASFKASKLTDTVLLNVSYGSNINSEGKPQNLSLNIYFPRNAVEGKLYPAVMLMHGGGFLTGNKDAMVGPCKQLADSGFIAVTINYRKGWNAASRMGDCEEIDIESLQQANYRALQDAHAALRFLAGNAKKYNIDTNWIFVGGSSAGAITALNVVYLNNQFAKSKFPQTVKELGPIDNATNSYKSRFTIKGICSMWGALPDSSLVNRTTAVPAIFYHGTADAVVPYDKGLSVPGCDKLPQLFGSATIYRQTLASGKVAVLTTSIGGKHGPVEHTRVKMMSNVACFFHSIMRGDAKSGSFTNIISGCR